MSSRSSSPRSTGSAVSRVRWRLLAAGGKEGEIGADRRDAVLVGIHLEVAHPGYARVHARPAELLLGHVLAGHRLRQVGAGQRHRAPPLDHRHEVGEAGDVGRARRAGAHQRGHLRDHPTGDHLLAKEVARAGEQGAGRLLDARPGRVEQPHHRYALAQCEVAQAGDLELPGHAHRTRHDREVVGRHGHGAAVDLAVAGDHPVRRRLPALHRALREMRAPVDAELHERSLVHQQREPLARGQLALLVLAGDPLLASARAGLLPALVQVINQGAQRRPGDQLVGGRAIGHGRDRRSSNGSSTRIAVSAMSARSSSSSGASKAVISRPTSSESSATASIRS